MITYLKGDATFPRGEGRKIIAHIVNNVSGWGAGFVLAISKRWEEPEARFRAWSPLELGTVQFVPVERDAQGQPTITVANMCAQRGYGAGNRNQHRSNEVDDRPPVDYEVLEECLNLLAKEAIEQGATVAMPKIGCGLGGGKWKHVEPLIQKQLAHVTVQVYDL